MPVNSTGGGASTSGGTYGLSGSGIDVDSVVAKLMKTERQPYVKLQQEQTVLGWKKEEYNTMYTGINDFRDNKLFKFQMQSNLAPKSVTSSSNSVLTVTASSDAVDVNHSIKVTQLANAVTESSSATITTGANKLTLASQFGLNGAFMMNINGKQIPVNSNQSINDVVSSINKSGAGVAANYDVASDRFFLYSKSPGANSSIDFAGSSSQGLSFLSNNLKLSAYVGVDNNGITSSADTGIVDVAAPLISQMPGFTGTLNLKISDGTVSKAIVIDTAINSTNDIINQINSLQSGDGKQLATASFENGKFILKSNNSDTTLDLTTNDNNTRNFLDNGLKLNTKKGQDAQFKLDGVTMSQPSNKFTMAGVTYNLQATGTSAIGITNDIDKIVANVKTFVEDYNKQLGAVYTKINETRYKDYAPLTDDQKTAMKEGDITLWTTKAKSGMLHSDTILRTLGETMRDIFSRNVSGLNSQYNNAASIGITSNDDWMENGKLYIDEEKLKKTLQDDPDVVYKIFGTTNSVPASQGLAIQLSGVMKTTADQIVKEAGITASATSDVTSTIGRQYKEYATNIDELNTKLASKERRYYSQFNSMETALSKLGQQSSSLSSMMANN